MGVPTLFRWLSSKYPQISVPLVEESEQEIDGIKIPIDFSKPNPNGIEFDNLYLDMNGIIHPCCHPEGKPAPPSEDEMMLNIFEYIDRIMCMIRPRKILYLAVDGVAPRAKMNQQRSRRFRSIQEALEEEADSKVAILEEDLSATFDLLEGKQESEVPMEKFDRNCITPGTPFMANLIVALRYYIAMRLNTEPGWRHLKVFLSDSSVPGEGEHKIMDFIRRQRCEPGYPATTKHVMYGLDADLIMLGLATHEPYFYILREVVYPPNPNANLCTQCLLPGHPSFLCRNKVKAEIDPITGRKPFLFLQVSVLREYLEAELNFHEHEAGFAFDLERVIDDWIFLCFFVGNDFLPHAPCLEIREGAIDLLTDIYKKNLHRLGGYITESGKVHVPRAQLIAKELGTQETQVFRLRKEESLKRAHIVKRKKVLDYCRQQQMSRAQIDARMEKFDRKMEAKAVKAKLKEEAYDVKAIEEKRLLKSMDMGQQAPLVEESVSNKDLVKYRHRTFNLLTVAQPIHKKEMKSIPVSKLGLASSSSTTSTSLVVEEEEVIKSEETTTTTTTMVSESLPPNETLLTDALKTKDLFSSNLTMDPALDQPTVIEPQEQPPLEPSQPVSLLPTSLSQGFPPESIDPTCLHVERDEDDNDDDSLPKEAPNVETGGDVEYPKYMDEDMEPPTTAEVVVESSMSEPCERSSLEKDDELVQVHDTMVPKKRKRSNLEVIDKTSTELLHETLDQVNVIPAMPIEAELEKEEPRKKRAVDVSEMSPEELLSLEQETNLNKEEILEELEPSEGVELNGDEVGEQDEEGDEDEEDEEEEEEEDELRLAEEGGASRYYQQKFQNDSLEFRKQVAQAYLEGMCWVLHYYYLGCASWKWFYPYHYAPLAVDFEKVEITEVNFELGAPFQPFDQLMAVFPPASRQHIPSVFHSLMTSPESDIIDFYPESFDIDLNGKKYAWQGVVLLPFIDETRLLTALRKKYPLLTEEEQALNQHGHDVLIVSATHMLFPTLCMLYGPTPTSSSTGSPQGDTTVSLPSASSDFKSVFSLKLSLYNDDISGFLGRDPHACPPGATFVSPFPNHLEEARNIVNNKSISAAYKVPPHSPSKFKSQLLPTLKLPPRKLAWNDVVQSSNFHRRRHPHILAEAYGGTQLSLLKPSGMPMQSEWPASESKSSGRHYPSYSDSHPKRMYSYSSPSYSSSSSSVGSTSLYPYSRTYPPPTSPTSSSSSSHYASVQHHSSSASSSSSYYGGRSYYRGTSSHRGYSSHPSHLHSSTSHLSHAPPVRAGNHTWKAPTYQSPPSSSSTSTSSLSSSSSSSSSFRGGAGSSGGRWTYPRGGAPSSRGVGGGGGGVHSASSSSSSSLSRSHYYHSEGYDGSGTGTSSGGGGYPQGQPRSGGTYGHLAWSRNLKRGGMSGNHRGRGGSGAPSSYQEY